MTQMAQTDTGKEAPMSNVNKTGTKMAQATGNPGNLPVALSPATVRPSLYVNRIPARFLSQLIAERNRMEVQRTRRRASAPIAVRAYGNTRYLLARHMPAGYNHYSEA